MTGRLLALFLLGYWCNIIDAFVVSTPLSTQRKYRRKNEILFPLEAVKSRSPRIGGRNKRNRATVQNNAPVDNKEKKVPWFLVVLGMGLLVPRLFFGGEVETSSTSYYFYQSSSSTVINIDGQVQTNRQESFKTNIPNLRPPESNAKADSETSLDVFMLQRLEEF